MNVNRKRRPRSTRPLMASNRGADRFPADRPAPNDSTSARPLRILIADDHVLLRELLATMVSGKGQSCEVVAQAGDAAEAIAACQEHRPDLLILDVNMPGRSGVDAVTEIKKISPKTRILLCCGTVTERELLAALQAGADGFMEKTSSGTDFLDAMERVAAGENYLCAKSVNILSAVMRKPPGESGAGAARKNSLTAREKEIMGLIVSGQSSKEIASKLFLSLATVETHRANLMTKIGAHNVAQLVRYALDHDLASAVTR